MYKKTELSTFLGILLALLLVLAAILYGTGNLFSYVDLPSLLIVGGGTFFVTCASYSIKDVVKAIGTTTQTMLHTDVDKSTIVNTSVRLAEIAKRNGILSIQKNVDMYKNMSVFFKKNLGLVIDGLTASEVEKLVVQEIISIRERHKKASEILRKAAELAPAMGLIGTLIGLVQMLGNLSDPSRIGPAMAIALLTTLYGAITAFVILNPLASKLEKNSREEIDILKMEGEAIVAIAKLEGPIRLEMRMNANLSPEDRIKLFS